MDDAITRAWHQYEYLKEGADGKKIGVARKHSYIVTRFINLMYVLLQRDNVLF